MIRVGDHRAASVETGGKTIGDSRLDLTVLVCGGVDSQEEGERRGVEGGRWIEGAAEVLASDVSVANDDAL